MPSKSFLMKNVSITPLSLHSELVSQLTKVDTAQRTLIELGEVFTAETPCSIIHQKDGYSVRYYSREQTDEDALRRPIFICYALVNRWYMLDLDPERSFIKHLMSLGHDVYVLDWGYPEVQDQFLDLDDYINTRLLECIEIACKHCDQKKIDLLGICQGGVLALCFSALHPEKINTLTLCVTPIDFHTADNALRSLTQHIDPYKIKETHGNIPGIFLSKTFAHLTPLKQSIDKQLSFMEACADQPSAKRFLRMEKWLNDCPDQAAAAFIEFQNLCFKQNALMTERMKIGQKPIDIKRIKCPIMNIYGKHDHLVPPASSKALRDLLDESVLYTELEVDAGHIGLFVSAKALKRVPNSISDWLSKG
jgi:polyhydroxyalkanoate synthase